ncbi:MAG: hypothetical protein J7L46_03770 [Bacteroidales bacterium]|nr:hypothetical protein [Bacteroidales bacterium]
MKAIGITFGFLLISLLTFSQAETKKAATNTKDKGTVKVIAVSSSKLKTDSAIYIKKTSASDQRQVQAMPVSKKISKTEKAIPVESKKNTVTPEKATTKKESETVPDRK